MRCLSDNLHSLFFYIIDHLKLAMKFKCTLFYNLLTNEIQAKMSIWHIFDPHDFHHSDLDMDEDEQSSSDESDGVGGGGQVLQEAEQEVVYTVYDYIYDCIEDGDAYQLNQILETATRPQVNPYNRQEELNLNVSRLSLLCSQQVPPH